MNFSSNQIGLTQATVYDISAADLAGANSGQRPDLLAKTQAIYRAPDGKPYSANAARSQLVPASVPVTSETNTLTGESGLQAGNDFVRLPVLGLVVDDPTYAASNTSILQAAFNAAGEVSALNQGTVWINDTLLIGSNTTAVFSRKTMVKMASGVKKSIIKNKALTVPFSSATVSWTAGNTAVVTWVGNTQAIGSSVWLRGIPGTAQSQYSGVFRVIDKAGDTLTILLRRRPTAAPAGAFEVKAADEDIAVLGLNVDYNVQGNGGASGTDTLSCVFGGVARLKIDTITARNTSKYCVAVGAVASFSVKDLWSPQANSDGLKIYGPAFDGAVSGITGRFNDDACSVQPQEAAPYAQYDFAGGGDCLNISVENISAKSDNAALFVLYASQHQYADDITIDGIAGLSAAPMVKFYNGVGFTNCQVGTVRLRNVTWSGNVDQNVVAFDGTQSYLSLEIDGLNGETAGGLAGLTKPPIIVNSGFIANFSVNRVAYNFQSNIPAVEITGTAGLTNVDVGACTLVGSSTGTLLKISTTTGGVGQVNVESIKAGPIGSLVNVTSTVTSQPNIKVGNVDVNAFVLVDMAASGRVHLAGSSKFQCSTGVVKCSGTGTNIAIDSYGNRLASGNWLNKTGTPNITINATDFSADVTQVARTAGSSFYNTNAAAGTLGAAGRVLCDASGTANSWKLMTDTTKSY